VILNVRNMCAKQTVSNDDNKGMYKLDVRWFENEHMVQEFKCVRCDKVPFEPYALILSDADDDNDDNVFVCKGCQTGNDKANKAFGVDILLKKQIIYCPMNKRVVSQNNNNEGNIVNGTYIGGPKCDWNGKLSLLKKHINICPLRMVNCEFKVYGCNIGEISYSELKKHLKQNELIHYKLKCKYLEDKVVDLISEQKDDMKNNDDINQLRTQNIGLKTDNERLNNKIISLRNELKKYKTKEESKFFICDTCKQNKSLNDKFIYECKHYHCIDCATLFVYTKLAKDKKHQKCFNNKCKKNISQNDVQNLSQKSPVMRKVLQKKELMVKYLCPKCIHEHKLKKWKDRNKSYECPTLKCGFNMCKKCKLPWDNLHKNLSCHEMKLLYNDQKHYIYCDRGHISHNNSDDGNKKYQKTGRCSLPGCIRKHCYSCQVSFSLLEYHDCGESRRQMKRKKVKQTFNKVTKVPHNIIW